MTGLWSVEAITVAMDIENEAEGPAQYVTRSRRRSDQEPQVLQPQAKVILPLQHLAILLSCLRLCQTVLLMDRE